MGKKSCGNCKYFLEAGKTWGMCNVPLPPWAWLFPDRWRIVGSGGGFDDEAENCPLFEPKEKKGDE